MGEEWLSTHVTAQKSLVMTAISTLQLQKNQQCTTESFGSLSSGLQIPSILGIKCFSCNPLDRTTLMAWTREVSSDRECHVQRPIVDVPITQRM